MLSRLVISVIALMVIVSCRPSREQCYEMYPPTIDTTERIIYANPDTIVEYQDLIVEVPVEKESDKNQTDTRTINGIVQSDTIIAKTSFSEAKTWVYDSKLYLTLNQQDSLIRYKVDSATRVVNVKWNTILERYIKEKPEVIKEKYVPLWNKILIGFLALLILGLLFVLIKTSIIKWR